MKIKNNEKVYIALNKPKGYVSARKDNVNKTIFSLITEKYKGLHIVGRLDKDTTGLIILTNDGEYTHNATHPKKHVNKTYEVSLLKKLSADDIESIENGLSIDHGKTKLKPAKVKVITDKKINLIISEGKFHQIKKMCFALNNEVVDLHRIEFDKIKLKDLDLELGEWKEIKSIN